MKKRELKNLINRLVAAIETPNDLSRKEVDELVQDATAAATELDENEGARWEIQHYTVADGWVNTWTTTKASGETKPVTFETEPEAQNALKEYLAETNEASMEYDEEEFRVVPVGTVLKNLE